jgi:hypothetical protein
VERPLTFRGKDIDLDIEGLNSKLSLLQGKYPQGLIAKTPEGRDFDAEAAVLIHETLTNLPDIVAGDQGFWAWLSLKFFWQVINWRMKSGDEAALPANFSCTSRREGLIERLWFRAELGRVNGYDPYQFVRSVKDTDFWMSGIVRRSYACNRAFATAFVRYQYPAPEGRLHATDEQGVRMLYKRLRRIYATVALDVLSESDAGSLIAELGSGLKLAEKKRKRAA